MKTDALEGESDCLPISPERLAKMQGAVTEIVPAFLQTKPLSETEP